MYTYYKTQSTTTWLKPKQHLHICYIYTIIYTCCPTKQINPSTLFVLKWKNIYHSYQVLLLHPNLFKDSNPYFLKISGSAVVSKKSVEHLKVFMVGKNSGGCVSEFFDTCLFVILIIMCWVIYSDRNCQCILRSVELSKNVQHKILIYTVPFTNIVQWKMKRL